jgi:hypothetical protein
LTACGRRVGKRHPRTRAVAGLDEDVRLNKALWHLAEALKLGIPQCQECWSAAPSRMAYVLNAFEEKLKKEHAEAFMSMAFLASQRMILD